MATSSLNEMRLYLCIFCTFVALSGVFGDAAVFSNAQQGQLLSTANTKFALDLYKRHASPAGQNIFMSPISISVALAMTYLGAGGETKAQMRQVLHFNDVEENQLHQAFDDIRTALSQSEEAYRRHMAAQLGYGDPNSVPEDLQDALNKPYQLYMANRLFGEQSYTFLAEFLTAGRTHYGAELEEVDFRGDSSGAAELINNWVAVKTNNKITDILSTADLSSMTRLILVNAVYFKGEWVHIFNEKNTTDDDFHISANEAVNVKMMYRKSRVYYGVNSELNCQALELPYAGEDVSMYILLPDQTTSLSQLEEKLTADDLANVGERFSMGMGEVNVWLPRFGLDMTLSLAKVLGDMGMTDLFDEKKADLSGIGGSQDLVVSKIVHRAVVEVRENGTEAAAATAVVVSAKSAPRPLEKFDFRANRPFLFFIQYRPTKSILFLGRLVKPPGLVKVTSAATGAAALSSWFLRVVLFIILATFTPYGRDR